MEDLAYNPLDFWCPHIIDAVLQHLTISELLELSKVSPEFWSFIKRYRRFKRNIAFTINSNRKFCSKELEAAMSNLRRNYDRFAAVGTEIISNLEVCSKQHTWKSISLSEMVFNRPTLLQNFIDNMKINLEELVMSSVFIFNCDKVVTLSLPKARILEMVECNDQENSPVKRVSFVISDCLDLRVLKLYYAGVSVENQIKLVKENKNLKVLTVVDVHENFFENLGKELRLEGLGVKFVESRVPSRLIFMKFIEPHVMSLHSLEICGWISVELMVLAYNMPLLSFLRIGNAKYWFARIDAEDFEERLNYSLSLHELVITDDLTPFEDIWLELTYKAPCLTNFRIESLEP